MTGRIEWRLAFKAALFGLALWFFSAGPSPSRFLVLVIFLSILYFPESLSDRRRLKVSFWLIPVLSAVFLVNLPDYPATVPVFLAILVPAVLFFGVLGLIRYLIPNQAVFYEILNTLIFIFLFLAWGGFAGPSAVSLWPLLGVFAASYLLFSEAFGFVSSFPSSRIKAVALVSAFFITQAAFFLFFLPLGSLNTAAFLGLLAVVVRSGFIAHFEGKFSAVFALRHLTTFVLITIIILAATNWSL